MTYAILKKGLASAMVVSGWNVTVFNLSSTSVKVHWTKLDKVVSRLAKFYIIDIESFQGTILTVETVPGNATSTVLKGLRPSMKYRVVVFGVDSIGQPYKSLQETIITTTAVTCGSRPSTTRIVGGTVASVNSWPWQVMVTDEYGSPFCGGSLVDPYWVVTAAHCIAGLIPSGVKARLGAHYRTNGSVGTEQNINVAKIIVHENYKTPLRYSNDIALLNLASPAELGKGVGLVCLPDIGHELPFDDLNQRCWITGWGDLSFWGSSPNTLMQASLPLVSKQRCENAHPGDIDDSMLCAGLDEGGVDTCQGDSGGPLVMQFNGTWYLEGVTSWGDGCAEPGKYGVYANVRALRSWLSTNIYMVVAPSVSPQNQSSPQSSSGIGGCNFDHGLCSGWNQSSSDDFDWTLAYGSTPSSSTGPTHGQGGSGKYMYTEATGRLEGDNAKLQLLLPRDSSSSCLTFFYHMYGYSMGTLNVFNGNTSIFTASGDQGDIWRKVTRTVNSNYVLTFEGIRGWSYASDIAIDNVTVSEGNCSVITSCNFDSGLCDGWEQSHSDVFNWTLNRGSTTSSNTGPNYDHTSGTGYYMYIETSSPRVAGDNAKLELSVPGNGGLSCLEFYYHMYGETVGTLTVFSGSGVVFNASGNHGDTWMQADITIHLNRIVTFEGIGGSSYTGDLAIDDVSVRSGSCQGQTTSPTISTTPILSPLVTSDPSTFYPPSSQASSSSGSSTSSPPSSEASASSGPTTSSPSSSQASSSTEQTTSSPSKNGPSSSSSFPSSALTGTFKSSTVPPTPSIAETQETIMMKIEDLNIAEWNEQMESDFKIKVAEAATAYCEVDPGRCGLTPASSRRKRSPDKIKFTSDMVQILPGYPKKSTDIPSIALLAFYLQLPQGFSGDIVDKGVLKAIVESKAPSIGRSVGGTIVSVQPLITTTETTEESDRESDPQIVIIVAASAGVILVVFIIALLFRFKKRKRLNAVKSKASNGFNNNVYFNNAYCIGSGEQGMERKSGDQALSSGKVPDLQRHYYAAVNDPHLSSYHSTVALKFPDSLAGKKSAEDVAPPIYQTLESGVDATIYQALNNDRVTSSIYQTLNKPKFSDA